MEVLEIFFTAINSHIGDILTGSFLLFLTIAIASVFIKNKHEYDTIVSDLYHDKRRMTPPAIIRRKPQEIPKEEGLKRINWGEVLEVIKAQSNGKRGEHISAAVMTTTIIDPNGNYLGGFACEYSGSGTKKEAEERDFNPAKSISDKLGTDGKSEKERNGGEDNKKKEKEKKEPRK